MRSLLIACFLALLCLVAACPPPLNDFYYIGNETHTTRDLIQGLEEVQSPATAWVEVVTKNGHARRTWPRGRIIYCFAEDKTRIDYADDIHDAWRLWADRLGEPGPSSGYQLTFKEHLFSKNAWPYCFKKRKDNEPFVWNTYVATDTLVIQESDLSGIDASNSATSGYFPPYWPSPGPKEGRHGLHLGRGSKAKWPLHQHWIGDIAHELGHVMGFYHEHQRYDRDHYVYFNCKALPGYERVKVEAEAKGLNMDAVCSNGYLAASLGFYLVSAFDTIDHVDSASPVDGNVVYLIQNSAKAYDGASIMHYPSYPKLWDYENDEEKMNVKITFWKGRNPRFTPPTNFGKDDLEFIFPKNWPSYQDIQAVKILYPV